MRLNSVKYINIKYIQYTVKQCFPTFFFNQSPLYSVLEGHDIAAIILIDII